MKYNIILVQYQYGEKLTDKNEKHRKEINQVIMNNKNELNDLIMNNKRKLEIMWNNFQAAQVDLTCDEEANITSKEDELRQSLKQVISRKYF